MPSACHKNVLKITFSSHYYYDMEDLTFNLHNSLKKNILLKISKELEKSINSECCRNNISDFEEVRDLVISMKSKIFEDEKIFLRESYFLSPKYNGSVLYDDDGQLNNYYIKITELFCVNEYTGQEDQSLVKVISRVKKE